MSSPDLDGGIRLDKWLWAARFFKTRHLATEAISGGKVQVNGQRAKPGKAIRVGARLTIHKESLEWEVEVTALSKQRRSAPEAASLYEEREESRLRRQTQVRERRERGAYSVEPAAKPSKRDRRMIERFTRKSDD
ncbi:MAG: S4 domain-containing protein [Chromatiaceae bacterium]